MMLDWKQYPELEVVTLTEENAAEVMAFLKSKGKSVSNEQGFAPGSPPFKVNGVRVEEGSKVFRRRTDGIVGVVPKKVETVS